MSKINKSRKLRNHIWFKQHGTVDRAPCHWCRRKFTFNQMTLDHEPPLSQGGKRECAVLACSPCNAKRNKIMQRELNLIGHIKKLNIIIAELSELFEQKRKRET